MIAYIDSSVILRVLLGQRPVLKQWAEWQRAYTSELAGIEARRVIDRLRLDGALDDEGVALAHEQLARIEASIGHIRLTRTILRRAALPMATVVRTLDALHLASALVLRERRGLALSFATHDDQQATAARALGFACLGV